MIKFANHSSLGRGDHILVKKLIKIGPSHSKYKEGADNKYFVTKGRIEKSPLGYYHFFEPETNELNPSFKNDDLEKLKEVVRKHLDK